jgi:hypothetical protein
MPMISYAMEARAQNGANVSVFKPPWTLAS